MVKFNTLLAAMVACAALLCGPARAAEDPSHFQLTQTLVDKLKAAETDMKMLQKPDEPAQPADADTSIDAAIRKIDQDAPTTAVLAKHGLTSRDLVLSAHALLHAGTFVSLEPTMDKKASTALYQGYTSEQRANIDLVRHILSGK